MTIVEVTKLLVMVLDLALEKLEESEWYGPDEKVLTKDDWFNLFLKEIQDKR